MGWSGLYLPVRLFGVSIVLVIDLDKPRGPKRHLTDTGVNIKPIPLIYYPPWVPLSQS